ncbi:MAG: hypothetical protein PHS21_06015 [Atribacterota bacterium]|nr:hypothetical protein [Atribacterota bacterium]
MGEMINKIRYNRKWQLSGLAIIIIIGLLAFWYFRTNPVLPQMTIYFLNEVKLPEAGDTIMVFPLILMMKPLPVVGISLNR